MHVRRLGSLVRPEERELRGIAARRDETVVAFIGARPCELADRLPAQIAASDRQRAAAVARESEVVLPEEDGATLHARRSLIAEIQCPCVLAASVDREQLGGGVIIDFEDHAMAIGVPVETNGDAFRRSDLVLAADTKLWFLVHSQVVVAIVCRFVP